jgi:CheY-like chemotaxis protein
MHLHRTEPLVLIADDNEANYELFSDFLAASRFAVVGASDGVEAVELAQQLLPDVIVMDFQLPLRDGCEAARLLKRDPRTRTIPILLLTGYVQEHFLEMGRQAGCDAYLLKPCLLDRMLAEIHRLLGLAPVEPVPAGRVLVVEDDEDIRESLAQVLRDEGYAVAAAANGREALAQLRSDEPRPDIILLDLMMPVMDGWQFRVAQQEDPQLAAIPVVILTALSDAKKATATWHGVPCLQKPVHLPQLFRALGERRP